MTGSLPGKVQFANIAIEAVKKIQQQLLLYGIVESILLISLLIYGQAIPNELTPIVYALAILILLIALAHFTLEFYGLQKKRPSRQNEKTKDGSIENSMRVFDRSDSSNFRQYIEELVLKSQQVVLIGTGLNILHRDPFALEVMNRAAKGDLSMEIYLANPNSPDVERRLIEEELGQIKPPVGRVGLTKHLEKFVGIWNDLGRPESIKINLFNHYPTFSLIKVDREYFIYPYGFATLGNFSPVFHLSSDNLTDSKAIKFFEEQYRKIKTYAYDAVTVQKIRRRKNEDVSRLYPFALYYIPTKDSSFYRFGSQILGYSVREPTSSNISPWQKQVGSARDFGFHLTLCDVLYFMNNADAKTALAEIKYFLQGFKPFELKELQLKQSVPDPNSISIVMKDPSGNLESLHFELVNRVYRRAIASNYSLGLYNPNRDQNVDRSRLMIDRYHAPYILQRYFPHFTLLAKVLPEEKNKIFEELKTAFSEEVKERSLRVEKVAIMCRPRVGDPWIIEDEIELDEKY